MGSLELDMTERLHFHFWLSCNGEGNGNPLQCFCLENPRDGKPGGLPSMGSHGVGHDWSDLAATAAACKDVEKCHGLQEGSVSWILRTQEAHFLDLKYLRNQSSLQSRHFFLFLHLYLFHFFEDNGVFCLHFPWCIYSFLWTHLITWFSQGSPWMTHMSDSLRPHGL